MIRNPDSGLGNLYIWFLKVRNLWRIRPTTFCSEGKTKKV